MSGTSSADRPYLGIALSGGALKASAHVGILNALSRLGIAPDCVAGTSAGALIAASYAHGYREADFQRMLRVFPGRKLLDYGFPVASSLWALFASRWLRRGHHTLPPLPNGLVRGRRLQRYIARVLSQREAQMPYYVIATDLLSGRPVTFSNDAHACARQIAFSIDNVAEAVAASCSLPGVLTPIRRAPWLLADGACRHYVPVRVLREIGCQKIIAINLYELDKEWTPHSFVHVLSRSYDILLQDAIEHDMAGDDLFVLSPDTGHMSWLSFDEIEGGIRAGERVVDDHKDELMAFLRTAQGRPRTISRRPARSAPSVRLGTTNVDKVSTTRA